MDRTKRSRKRQLPTKDYERNGLEVSERRIPPMKSKPRPKTDSLEDAVRLLCEQLKKMNEEEKTELRNELLNNSEIPRHFRWLN
jgi:hypothetical protein